jgi:hypothetical protein
MKRWRTFAGIGTAITIVVIAGVLVARVNSYKTPDQMTAHAIAGLLKTSDKLKASLESTPSGETVGQYLDYMDEFEGSCRQINHANDTAKKAALNAEAAEAAINKGSYARLENAVSLCKDLGPVVADTKSIYKAVEPLLAASTTTKRWQTLPWLKDSRRDRDLKHSEQAVEQLNSRVKKIEYPTHALTESKQLQTAIVHSKGLNYLPSLSRFQDQLLAERVQYWTSYAGLSNMRQNLKIQLEQSCLGLKAAGNSIKECKHVKA